MPSLAVPHSYSSLPEGKVHGAAVATELLTDTDQRQPGGIQLGGPFDLSGRQGTSTERYAFSLQELGHRSRVDPELLRQLGGRSSRFCSQQPTRRPDPVSAVDEWPWEFYYSPILARMGQSEEVVKTFSLVSNIEPLRGSP
jgi:hypothetical protein